MTKYCVLVVDDQRDIRRVLRAGLETLETDLQVIDVPSGEEALLVLSNQPVDVLVTDVRLPGISGLELKDRARQRNPNVDLILITGLSDPGIRQDIEAAGVAAFFYKPVEMAEFLDAVTRCLQRSKTSLGPVNVTDPEMDDQEEQEPLSLAGELSNLRQVLNANAVMLLDGSGRSIAQAGEIPDNLNDEPFAPTILAASHAGAELSNYLGMLVPESYSIFRGLKSDFLVAHVGPTATLLISVPAGFTPRTLGERFAMVGKSVQTLLAILQTEAEVPAPVQVSQPLAETEDETIADVEVEPELDEIFDLANRENYDPKEIDAFWNSLVEDDKTEGVINANAISYDQARQLGLTPDQDTG